MAYIDCSVIIEKIESDIIKKVEIANKEINIAIIRVGDNPDDIAYENSIVKKLGKFNINCLKFTYPKNIADNEFKKQFRGINDSSQIHGILVLAPLPKNIDFEWIAQEIDPKKDLDSISPTNIVKFYDGEEKKLPCTPQAVIKVLDKVLDSYKGKKIAIVGTGKVVGKPLATVLMEKGATLITCNEFTKNLSEMTKQADVIVSAAGVANLIRAEHVNSDSVVVDVGINLNEDNKIVGDANVDLHKVVAQITPVKNGIGNITTLLLANKLVDAANE